MGDTAARQSPPREPIARVKLDRLGDLDPLERRAISDACYELWTEFFEGMTRERFFETHLFDDTYLATAYGADGRLAAFTNINLLELTVAGERVLVMTSGVFIRLEYDGSVALKRQAFRLVLRLRLRRPFARFVWVPIATTPVAYRTLAKSSRRFYPHPDLVPPDYVAPTLAALVRARKLDVDPHDPFVVNFGIRQRRGDDLRESASMQRLDRFKRHFLERIPNWDQGRALLVLIPFDLWSLLSSAVMLARRSSRTRHRRARGAAWVRLVGARLSSSPEKTFATPDARPSHADAAALPSSCPRRVRGAC